MSRYDCNRSGCDWKPSDDDEISEQGQLAEHATESRHWLCRCCWLSLTDETADWFGCESCLTEARSLLSGIVLMWLDLPNQLGHLHGAQLDGRRGGGDGRPLLGGDVLSLMGPGSNGGAGRRLLSSEKAQGERWWIKGGIGPLTQAGIMQAERERWGREHAADHRRDDAPSVAFELMRLEDDWRSVRGEPAATVTGSTTRVLRASVRYLDTFTRWAAQRHEAFPEYLSDLRDLHARLERATSQHEHVVRSEVGCVECGATLIREDNPARPCDHTPPLPPEHEHCDQGGLRDDWICPRKSCSQRYDAERYALLASEMQREKLREHWVPVDQAARFLHMPVETLRTWVKRGQIAKDRNRDGQTVVWFDEVETRRMQQEAS